MRMIRAALCAAIPMLAASAAAAQTGPQERYRACLERSEAEPVEAYEDALAWATAGGGALAEHCAAIALLRVGHEEEAATRLERLAGAAPDDAPDIRAEYLRQAASAWLLAGELARAETASTAALAAAPDDAELSLLRARVRLDAENYPGAEADLDQVVARWPDLAEARIMRAHARLGQGALTAAKADAEAAVAADPESVEARLALGDVREAIRASTAEIEDES